MLRSGTTKKILKVKYELHSPQGEKLMLEIPHSLYLPLSLEEIPKESHLENIHKLQASTRSRFPGLDSPWPFSNSPD